MCCGVFRALDVLYFACCLSGLFVLPLSLLLLLLLLLLISMLFDVFVAVPVAVVVAMVVVESCSRLLFAFVGVLSVQNSLLIAFVCSHELVRPPVHRVVFIALPLRWATLSSSTS